MDAKQSFSVLDLLKQIHKTFSKRGEFTQALPEVFIPSFRTDDIQSRTQRSDFDPGVIQAADALMEVAFTVKAVVEPQSVLVAAADAATGRQEVRIKDLETTLTRLYAEKRKLEQDAAQIQDKFKKGS